MLQTTNQVFFTPNIYIPIIPYQSLYISWIFMVKIHHLLFLYMVFLWFLWFFYGFPMVFLWFSCSFLWLSGMITKPRAKNMAQ